MFYCTDFVQIFEFANFHYYFTSVQIIDDVTDEQSIDKFGERVLFQFVRLLM